MKIVVTLIQRHELTAGMVQENNI